ncbi:VOC family protein [Kribbella sp. NBC_00482]|uniref:VOC family protein n=1 Tax=Kribbella sp. NBC_00482 TaxID=2975968 RepID=UPI002E17CD3D
MKPATTVVSMPVTDLERTLRFCRDGLGLETAGIDGPMILIELPNLSLFLIERQEYAMYAGRGGMPDAGGPAPGACIISCAIGSKEEVDETVARAKLAGGSTPADPREYDGSYVGYVSDPDGHLWELVWNTRTEAAAK